MIRRPWRGWAALLAVLLAQAVLLTLACTVSGGTSAPDAGDSSQQRDLAAVLAEVQASQAAALALWDRVIFGEVVSCQDYIPVPEPVQRSSQDSQSYPIRVWWRID